MARRSLLRAAVAALALLLPLEAFLPHGGGSSGPAGDALTQLLLPMSVGQVKRLSGAVGAIVTDTNNFFPFTRADYDAYGTGTFGTFSSGANLGTGNAANMTAYSQAAIDTDNLVAVYAAAGGHVAYQDGSIKRFDILAAAAAINAASGTGHWTRGAAGAKWTPVTDPKPASSHDVYGGTFSTATANGSSGSASITLTGITWSNPADPTFHGGEFISQVGQTPTNIPAGSNIGTWTPATANSGTLTLHSPNVLQGTLTNASVQLVSSQDFWGGNSSAGQSMPVSCHTYNAVQHIPGTRKFTTGGQFCNISGIFTTPGQGYIYTDGAADGSNVVVSSNTFASGYGNHGSSNFCADGALYSWNFAAQQIDKWVPPFGAVGNVTSPLKTGVPGGATFATAGILPDPVNAGFQAYFVFNNATGGAGGGEIIEKLCNVSGSGTLTAASVTTPTGGSAPSTFLPNLANNLGNGGSVYYTYNVDQGALAVCDASNGGQVVLVSINSSLVATLSNQFGSLTGDTITNTGNGLSCEYLQKYGAYIWIDAGNVYVIKAK